ncbi:DNA-directed RNA polymerase III subunit Rpc31-domain-containing protein [Phyllosticta citriasiana]|uniref:DNA-directed RNA polymerase III subunit Rpc31-domain-containing protein n=1 Tax=Phyllosticta citriasiana TaxID=595635 RepID=UPI0030FD4F18
MAPPRLILCPSPPSLASTTQDAHSQWTPRNLIPKAGPEADDLQAQGAGLWHPRLVAMRRLQLPAIALFGSAFMRVLSTPSSATRRASTKNRGTQTTAQSNPFESMPTYTQKYKKQRRTIPRLDTRPYVESFFPTELWATLEPHEKDGANAEARKKRKKLQVALSTRLSRLEQLEEDGTSATTMTKTWTKMTTRDKVEEEQDVDFEEDEEDNDDYKRRAVL